jgi:hypothetical protein
MKVTHMKILFLVFTAPALLIGAGTAIAAPHGGHGAAMMNPGASIGSTAPLTPELNPGALGAPAEFGTPPVNTGAIGPAAQEGINAQDYGAVPGEPGSATYDPNAALPSLDNQGSAVAPNPGTSAAGFRSPSTNSGAGTNSGF